MKRLLAISLFFSINMGVFAQNLQSPEVFFGHELGSKFQYHFELIDYFKYVAANTPTVALFQNGRTHERRQLVYAVITAEENHKNLAQIRKNNLIAAGLMEGTIQGKQLPIIWLSHSIHGNETAGLMASFKLIYELAAANLPAINDWLKEMIIVIDPSENPDGYARYTNWYNRTATLPKPNVNPDAWEHNEAWPGGRYNHYLFDMNRDWAWQTQVETQQRIKSYQQWMPQVHIDLHEMGLNAPYYNGWAAKPFHRAITPWQREFMQLVGKNNAQHFDQNGWLYFTKEIFDLFYPSYGDTWPIFNGAIGFTFEQGGSGRGGVAAKTETGNLLTLQERLLHHFTASMATIETTYAHKEKVLSTFNNYFKEAKTNPKALYKTYVIKASNNAQRLRAFLKTLTDNKIVFGYPASTGKILSGFSYLKNRRENFTISKNDIIISAYQARARLAQVLLEPTSDLEDSLTYDLTAWSLPYVYELESYCTTSRIDLADTPVGFSFKENEAQTAYAFFAQWKDLRDVKFLAALLKANIKVRYTLNPFAINGQTYDAGTLTITKADNNTLSDFENTVIEIANAHQNELFATQTGLVTSGNDLGASSWVYIEKPSIALLNGAGVYPPAVGELWHFFEQQLDYPITLLNKRNFQYADLSKFNLLILPAGTYDAQENRIITFVKNGGRVIVMERAIATFTHKTATTSLAKALETYQEERKKNKPKANLLDPYGNRIRSSLVGKSTGSVYKIYMDKTHPMSFGDDDEIHIIKRNNTVYPYMEKGWNVGIFKEDSHISGFYWK